MVSFDLKRPARAIVAVATAVGSSIVGSSAEFSRTDPRLSADADALTVTGGAIAAENAEESDQRSRKPTCQQVQRQRLQVAEWEEVWVPRSTKDPPARGTLSTETGQDVVRTPRGTEAFSHCPGTYPPIHSDSETLREMNAAPAPPYQTGTSGNTPS